MEMTFAKFGECMECGHSSRLEYFEDVEVAYPSHGLDPEWRVEKECPKCGSTHVAVTIDEV